MLISELVSATAGLLVSVHLRSAPFPTLLSFGSSESRLFFF